MAEENREERATWVHAALKMGMSAAAHPLEYVKVLIQIGYEPVPPRPTKTLFGRPALQLAGVFEYMAYIRDRDGIIGMYRGVVPRLCGNMLSGYVFGKVVQNIELEPSIDNEMPPNEENFGQFIKVTSRDMVARCLAIVASQPFQVITVRMMAQFIGRETQYEGTVASFKEILKHDGITGLYVGLFPRIMAEVFSLWITSSLTFLINSYVLEDGGIKEYTGSLMAIIASSVTYPFNLIANIMAVNNSGLIAGEPPIMPVYPSWSACWTDLSSTNQLKRGSSLIWRYYTGPLISKEGSDILNISKKPSYSSSQSSTQIITNLSQTKLPLEKGFNSAPSE